MNNSTVFIVICVLHRNLLFVFCLHSLSVCRIYCKFCILGRNIYFCPLICSGVTNVEANTDVDMCDLRDCVVLAFILLYLSVFLVQLLMCLPE